MNEKWKDLFRNYIGYLAVSLVCIAYIATAFVQIEESGKSIAQIIADGVISFLMGILINRIFDTQGLMNGDRDEKVMKTTFLHNQIVDRIYPYMDRLEDWCEEKNAEALKRARRQYLSRHGMRYADYFEEDGTALSFTHKTGLRGFRQKNAEFLRSFRFHKALKLRLTKITAGLLISDAGQADDPYFMGRSKSEYVSATSKKDVITKLLTAAVFGYYGVSLIRDFSYANLIWTVLQVGIFLVMGVIKMQQSFLYVTDEYRGRIIKKIDVLQTFELSINPKKEVEYEHNQENPNANGAGSVSE